MASNPMLKIAAAVVLLFAVMIGVAKCGGPDEGSVAGPETGIPRSGGEPLDEETLEAMAIEGDTEEDTVRTLVTTVRDAKRQLEETQAENRELKAANEQLLGMQDQMEGQLRGEMRSLVRDLESENNRKLESKQVEVQGILDQVKRQMGALSDGQNSRPSAGFSGADGSGTVWISPIDSGGVASSGFGTARSRPPGGSSLDALPSLPRASDLEYAKGIPERDEVTVHPAFTIAKNSTLVGATAMTALIGRVPIGTDVTDPYSFKVIVGHDNLIANGKEVPELAYAIMSGTAIGDWTLGCVAGDIFSITFVFEDGRIRTVPEPPDITKGSAQVRNVKIGELSDAFGNPCVVGRKITNAPKYLAGRVGAIAAGAAAQAAAAAETTQTANTIGGIGGGTTVVDGDEARFVLGNTLAGAAQETANWIAERQSLSFDAIYREPGAEVAIHITEEIRIDYDELGRMTHHEGFLPGRKYRELD